VLAYQKNKKTINVVKGVLEVHHENNATTNIPIQNETLKGEGGKIKDEET
jgi:hypothetical protein